MTTILKPCPFCGGKAEFNPLDDENGYTAYIHIYCCECGAKSGTIRLHIMDNCGGYGSQWRLPYENKAIELWNKRSDVSQEVKP